MLFKNEHQHSRVCLIQISGFVTKNIFEKRIIPIPFLQGSPLSLSLKIMPVPLHRGRHECLSKSQMRKSEMHLVKHVICADVFHLLSNWIYQ